MEHRSTTSIAAPAGVRFRAGGAVIFGIGAVFYDGTPRTEYQLWEGARERIMPGAFLPVMQNDVRGLFNHDPSKLLGRTASGTMKLKTTRAGLHYEITPGDTATARDVIEMIRRGDVTGSSFAFSVGRDEWTRESGQDIRSVWEIKSLLDTGPVTYPAYTATTAGIRSATDDGSARSSYERTKARIDQTKPMLR